MEEDGKGTTLGNVIRIDDEQVREHLGHVVRGTVEETPARGRERRRSPSPCQYCQQRPTE
jgi:hypothetical protein